MAAFHFGIEVGRGAADFTPKHCAEAARRKSPLPLAVADSNVEVGTKNADFNVFFIAAETETRRCEDGFLSTPKGLSMLPLAHWNRALILLSRLRTKASQELTQTNPNFSLKMERKLELGPKPVGRHSAEHRLPLARSVSSPFIDLREGLSAEHPDQRKPGHSLAAKTAVQECSSAPAQQ